MQDFESITQIIIAIFTGINLLTTIKIAISIGEYKKQVEINTDEITRLRDQRSISNRDLVHF